MNFEMKGTCGGIDDDVERLGRTMTVVVVARRL